MLPETSLGGHHPSRRQVPEFQAPAIAERRLDPTKDLVAREPHHLLKSPTHVARRRTVEPDASFIESSVGLHERSLDVSNHESPEHRRAHVVDEVAAQAAERRRVRVQVFSRGRPCGGTLGRAPERWPRTRRS